MSPATTTARWAEMVHVETLGDVLAFFVEQRLNEHHYTPRTMVEYQRVVERLERSLGAKRLTELEGRDLEGFLASVPPGSLPSTYATVAAVFRWLEGRGLEGLVSLLPKRRPRRQRRARALGDDEYARLWAGLHDSRVVRGMWTRTVVALRLAVLVPLRRGELVTLAWSEVDLPGRRLFLQETKTGDRVLPLPRTAAALLLELPQAHHYVFPGRAGRGHLADTSLGHAFERVALTVGLNAADTPRARRVSLHTLRQSWGAKARRDGMPARLVRLMLGHSTAYMATQHAHAAAAELELYVDAFDRSVAGDYQLGLPLPVEGGSR